MTVCAIMQPTYLPWSGFFNLIARADKFVFLDDVQWQRRSWQVRNRILLDGSTYMLTVPVQRCPRSTRLDAVRFAAGSDWTAKHLALIKQAYGKADYGRELIDFLEPFYSVMDDLFLARFTSRLTISLAQRLGLDCEFFWASDLACCGRRSEHLKNICIRLNCSKYLSPLGAEEYLELDGFEDLSAVRLELQSYLPVPYRQLGSDSFVSHLSVVDVIANLGFEGAAKYCRAHYEN